MIFADLLQVDAATCIKPACSSQLVASLLTTCNKLVIIKLEQAMRTHPDVGLVIWETYCNLRVSGCVDVTIHFDMEPMLTQNFESIFTCLLERRYEPYLYCYQYLVSLGYLVYLGFHQTLWLLCISL